MDDATRSDRSALDTSARASAPGQPAATGQPHAVDEAGAADASARAGAPEEPAAVRRPEREPRARTGHRAMRVAARLRDGLQRHDLFGLAAEIAYQFLFAIFPFGLFVAALAAFVASALRIDNPAARIVSALGDNLPGPVASAVAPELQRLVSSPRADLLSIGAILALWSATGGTNALVKGMHRAYDVPESRPFLLRYAVAITLTLLAAVGVVASFVTIVGGSFATQQLAAQFGLGGTAWSAIQLLRWPVVLAGLSIAVAILYRYAPNVVVPWRWIAIGAVAFSIGWLVVTAGFAYYATNVANYGATYGSLGGVIALMVWLYLTGVLLLLGAELTAALARELAPGSIRRRREEEAATAVVDGAAQEARRQVGSITDTARS